MICEVVGKVKRPYELENGKKGISCRLSVHIGQYVEDKSAGIEAEGEQFAEYRCSDSIADLLKVGDTIFAELDDMKTRIKSVMVKNEDGSFFPID